MSHSILLEVWTCGPGLQRHKIGVTLLVGNFHFKQEEKSVPFRSIWVSHLGATHRLRSDKYLWRQAVGVFTLFPGCLAVTSKDGDEGKASAPRPPLKTKQTNKSPKAQHTELTVEEEFCCVYVLKKYPGLGIA